MLKTGNSDAFFREKCLTKNTRESLGGRTPYDVALDNYGIDILKALQLRPIPHDEVNLTPKLIRFNH